MVGTVINDAIFLCFSNLETREAVGIADVGGKQTVLPTERARQGASAPKPCS